MEKLSNISIKNFNIYLIIKIFVKIQFITKFYKTYFLY